MKKTIFACLLALAVNANAAIGTVVRTVVENVPASGNTIMVSTPSVRVGVGTSSPATTLDVNGVTRTTALLTGPIAASSMSVSGDLTAGTYHGDGSALDGLLPLTGGELTGGLTLASGANVNAIGAGTPSANYGTPANAFDGDPGTYWTGIGLPAWLQYDFGTAKHIVSYTVTALISYGTEAPKTFSLSGSNTGSFTGEQTVLDNQAGPLSWVAGETKSFTISTPASFRYYRMNITVAGPGVVCVAELVMYAPEPATITLSTAGNVTAVNFYGNGSALVGISSATSAIAISTGVMQGSINNIILSTGVIYAQLVSSGNALVAEIARATTRENAIGISTGSIAVSTGSIFTQLTSTGNALVAEIARATNKENAIVATISTAVYTNGSYADPAWLTSVAAAKIAGGSLGSTVIASSVAITAAARLWGRNTFTDQQDFNGHLVCNSPYTIYGDAAGITGTAANFNIGGNAATASVANYATSLLGVLTSTQVAPGALNAVTSLTASSITATTALIGSASTPSVITVAGSGSNPVPNGTYPLSGTYNSMAAYAMGTSFYIWWNTQFWVLSTILGDDTVAWYADDTNINTWTAWHGGVTGAPTTTGVYTQIAIDSAGNVITGGNITATNFYGNGSYLVGVSSPTSAIAVSTGVINADLQAYKVTVQSSTQAIQTSLSNVILSTGAINAVLLSEISRATTRENAIGVSTGAIALSTGAINADLQAYRTTVQSSTQAIYNQVVSSGNALVAEIVRATARENAIAISTGNIAVSTGTLYSWGNSLGNHVATTTLQMGTYGVNSSSTINAGNVLVTWPTAPTYAGEAGALNLRYQGGNTNGSVGAGLNFSQWYNADGSLGQSPVGGIYGVKTTVSGAPGGGLAFYSQPNGSAPGMTEVMRINGASNVGVGTTNPITKLEVTGDITASAYHGNGSALTNTIQDAIILSTGAETAARVSADNAIILSTQALANATNLNTASTIVKRDASGNFSAGTITANLTGNASGTAATVTTAAQPAITSVGTLTHLMDSGPLQASSITVTGNAFSVGTSTLVVVGGRVGIGRVVSASDNLFTVQGTTETLYSPNQFGGLDHDNIPSLTIRNQSTTAQTVSALKLVTRGSTGASQWGIFNVLRTNNSGDLVFGYGASNLGTEFMRLRDQNGFMGIGTATPDQKLTVAGNISTTGQVISSGTGSNYFAGLVGIGTTNPATALQVAGTATATLFSGPLTGTLNTAAQPNITSVGTLTGLKVNGGIGIYTASPVTRLQIVDATLQGPFEQPPTYFGLSIQRGYAGAAAAAISVQGSSKSYVTAGGAARLYLGNADEYDSTAIFGGSGILAFHVRNAGATLGEVARITPSGSLGINTVSPDQKLTVAGNISTTGQIISSGTGGNYFTGPVNLTSLSNALKLTVTKQNAGLIARFQEAADSVNNGHETHISVGSYLGASNSTFLGYHYTAGASYGYLGIEPMSSLKAISFNSLGKVSIGVANPAPPAILSVSSAAYSGGVNLFQIGGGTMTVLASGNIGIGTTDPTTKLYVEGSAVVTGTATFTNNQQFYQTSTFNGTISAEGINAGDITADSINAVHYGDGTNLTGIATTAGSNLWTGINEWENQVTFSSPALMSNIQFLSESAATIMDSDWKAIVMNGLQVNLSRDYAFNWVKASTASLSALYYDVGLDIGQYMQFDKYGLIISSGLRAGASRVDGSGGVNIINSDGKIPAISSVYFANLSGANLTGLPGDSTKLPLGGGTMTGSLIFEPTAISTGQLIFQGGYPHSIQFNNQSATSGAEFLGEVQFLQSGTGKSRIISYGDTHATYPKEIQIGADSTGAGTNVRITGNTSMNPDLFVSSWAVVGVNTATPNAAYKLDVNGTINASGVYKNGVEIVPVGDAASLSSTQTFTGANTFAGSMYGVHNASATYITVSTSAYSNSYGDCIPGSSVTIVTHGNPIEINFNGFISQNQFASGCYQDLSVRINGVLLDNNKALGRARYTTNNAYVHSIFSTIQNVAAGSNGVCLVWRTMPTDPCGTSYMNSDPTEFNQFWVKELQ